MTPAGSHQREVGETGTCAPLPGTSRLTSHTLSKAPTSDAPETQALDNFFFKKSQKPVFLCETFSDFSLLSENIFQFDAWYL